MNQWIGDPSKAIDGMKENGILMALFTGGTMVYGGGFYYGSCMVENMIFGVFLLSFCLLGDMYSFYCA